MLHNFTVDQEGSFDVALGADGDGSHCTRLLVFIRRSLERIPGWAFQLIVGFIMMGISAFLMLLGERK